MMGLIFAICFFLFVMFIMLFFGELFLGNGKATKNLMYAAIVIVIAITSLNVNTHLIKKEKEEKISELTRKNQE